MNCRKIVATLILLSLLAGTSYLTGCNTWEGAGKDVEKAGDSMQGD